MKVRLFIAVSVFIGLFSVANAEQGNGILLASTNFGKASVVKGAARIVKAEDILKLADYDEELVILDVRNKASRKTGNITWSEEFRSSQAAFQQFNKKVSDKGTTIVIYGDKNSSIAAKSAQKMKAQGYTNVYWFKGGYAEWKRKGLRIDL